MAESKVTWASLPRKDQLVILFLVRFCEPIVKVSISSYVYFQLQSLDKSLSSAAVVQQTTLLQAAYTIAQCLASMFLGSIADSSWGGRKGVVVISLLGSFVACSLFGFVANFKQALVLRFVEGLTNGTVAMVRTMTAEVVQEKKYQARAFVLLNISTSFAIILSALVAAGTVELTPKAHGSGLLARYPYALPALLNASFLLVVLVTAVLFLEETSKLVRHRYDPGIALSRYIICRLQFFRSCISQQALYDPVDASEEMAFLDEPELPSPPPKLESVARLPTTRMFTKNMVLVLLAAFIYEAHLGTASVAFPNLLVTPVSSTEEETQRVLPFFFGGGAGFTPLPLAAYSVMY
ncbi:major facilitator superfamily transporter, partial [Colletotrichum sp. SAR11_239]